MRIDVLRRSDGLKGTTAADELARLQVVARDEVVALRDLMQQMRPSELDPDELLDNMADFVQRFARDLHCRALRHPASRCPSPSASLLRAAAYLPGVARAMSGNTATRKT